MRLFDTHSEIEPGLWMGGCPHDESPAFAQAVLNLFGRHEYRRRCLEYREARLLDLDVPDPALLEDLARWVHEQRQRGLTVLVHCQEGRNRSGLITALYLIRYRGLEPKSAIDLIRAKRGANSPYNGSFVRYLASVQPGMNSE